MCYIKQYRKEILEMKKNKGKLRLNKKFLVSIFIILIILCVSVFTFARNNDENLEGRQYIEKLESKDITSVKKKVLKIRSKERKQAIKDGKLDVFSQFEDYVFLGDSRVVGYSTYNCLDDSRIFAEAGATIKYVDNYLEQIKNLQPSNVILSYGVNDMGLDLDSSDGGYGSLYESQVNKILKIVPDAQIYICAIIPCTPATLEKSPRWGKQDTYNKQLKKICKKNNWTYIDDDSLVDGGNADVYQDDGIHFKSDFYKTWAEKITEAMMDNEE
jgi:hypothetical protein